MTELWGQVDPRNFPPIPESRNDRIVRLAIELVDWWGLGQEDRHPKVQNLIDAVREKPYWDGLRTPCDTCVMYGDPWSPGCEDNK